MVLELKHSFLIDEYTDDDCEKNNIANKRAKGTKTCAIKRGERSYLTTMLINCLKMKYC